MAELLCIAKPTPLSGDDARDALAWRRGDVVVVEEDGHAWRPGESRAAWVADGRNNADWPGKFFIIKIPGVSASVVRDKLREQKTRTDLVSDPTEALTVKPIIRVLRRRLNFLDVDATPQQIKQAIGRDYEITVTPTQIKSYLKNRDDGLTIDAGI